MKKRHIHRERLPLCDINTESLQHFTYDGFVMTESSSQYLHQVLRGFMEPMRTCPLCKHILQDTHHRTITGQSEIQQAIRKRTALITFMRSHESRDFSHTIHDMFLYAQIIPFTKQNSTMIDRKIIRFDIDFDILDIIINYPMLVPLIGHNLFVVNGLHALSSSWDEHDSIPVLDRISDMLMSDEDHIAEIVAILRYGKDEQDISEALDMVCNGSLHVNSEYYAPFHVCDGVNAREIFTMSHDHDTALRMIRRSSKHGYVSWYDVMDIAAHHDDDMMRMLSIYDKILGIYEPDIDGDHPDWVSDYLIYSYSHYSMMMVPSNLFTKDALKDMEEYPYEFNYENIGIRAYESWKPKNMMAFMADGIRSMITGKH